MKILNRAKNMFQISKGKTEEPSETGILKPTGRTINTRATPSRWEKR